MHEVAWQHEPCSVRHKVCIVTPQSEEVRLCEVLLPHVVGGSVSSRGGWGGAREFFLKQMALNFRLELTNDGNHAKLKARQCNVGKDVIKVVPVARSRAAIPANVCITALWRLSARTVTTTRSSCAIQLQRC